MVRLTELLGLMVVSLVLSSPTDSTVRLCHGQSCRSFIVPSTAHNEGEKANMFRMIQQQATYLTNGHISLILVDIDGAQVFQKAKLLEAYIV